MTAPNTSDAMTMVVNRKGLSLVPSVRMAVSVASPGVLSTNTSPTASTSDGIDRENPDKSSPTASATPAPNTPAIAAYRAGGPSGGVAGVRRTGAAGIVLVILALFRRPPPTLRLARRFRLSALAWLSDNPPSSAALAQR